MSILSLNQIDHDWFKPQMMYLTWNPSVIPQAAFALFGIAWIISMILYINSFIIMMSAATYYFSTGGEHNNEPQAEVLWAVKQVIFNHLGSLAKGTLLVSILNVLKFLFLYPAK
jgi:hypothetical protein